MSKPVFFLLAMGISFIYFFNFFIKIVRKNPFTFFYYRCKDGLTILPAIHLDNFSDDEDYL